MRDLSNCEVRQTAAWLASCQLPSGMVPWYKGGHADPWNHTEVAMALALGGEWEAVRRCFAWLAGQQLDDGSWCTFYVADGVIEPRRDPNVCAYVATGAWWCAQLLGDDGPAFLAEVWPMVDGAINWSLGCQLPSGQFAWSVGPDGVRGNFSLLAATSSLQHSILNGARVAAATGHDRWHWEVAAGRAAAVVAERPGSFAPKKRWAMDWYYPSLSGALGEQAARRALLSRWEEFIVPGLGVRCVADRPWVTAAETAECAMAMGMAGLSPEATQLLSWAEHLRDGDGSYWTGCVHPECIRFPGGQKSTYSAAAVLIADHVLYQKGAAAKLFSRPSTAPAQGAEAAPPPAAAITAVAALRPEAMHAGTPEPS